MQLIQGVSLDAWIDHLKSGRGDHAEPGLSSADADAVDEIVGRIGGGPGAAYDRHVARWVATIAAALEYAHGQGVLHRDIKPSNLILDREGTVWLTDFGLASREASDRMTQTGELVGTLRYMAPEQLRGESYADALATYRSLAKRDPHDPAWLLQQAGVLNELMRIAAGRGRLGEARKLFETTESLIASFTSGSSATSPRDSREVRFLMAKTLSIVVSFELRGVNPDPKRRPSPGRFRRSTGPNRSEPGDDGTPRVRRAAEANGRALELVGSLLAEDPGNVAYRTALAMAHRDGAKIDRAGGRPDDAAGHRAAAIALLERIAKEYPNSAAIQYQLAEVLLDGSVLGIARGGGFGISAVDAVAEDLTRVIRISESLIAGQPDSIPYRALYATAQIRLAAAHAAAGRPQRALTTLRSSIEAQQIFVDRSPEVILHRITLAQSLRNLAELEANRGDREAAMKTLDRAIATIERTVQERPSRPFLYSLLKRLRDRRDLM